MKKLKMAFTIIFVVIFIAAIALRLAMPKLAGTSVATGIVASDDGASLGPCPDTPNCAVATFALSKPAGDAAGTLAGIIASQPGTAIVTQDERYLHATYSTKIMGYIDDVELLVRDDEQSVQVRSASRVGKSDLGANAKRVAELQELVSGKI